MTTWRARLAVFGVFLAGFVCGSVTMHLMRLHFENRIYHSEAPMAEVIVYKLDQELDLTSEQESAVRRAIVDSRDDMLSMKTRILPEVIDILTHTEARIRGVLDPEQKVKFDKIVSERFRILLRHQKQVKEGETAGQQ